ncbi:MAG: hypothetical protein ABW166_01410 [Sedimenticola sp.]
MGWVRTFFRGTLFGIKKLSGGGKWHHVSVLSISYLDCAAPRIGANKPLSDELKLKQQKIFADFEDAMITHRVNGVRSELAEYQMTIDIKLRKEGEL